MAVGELGEVSPVSGVGLPGTWRPGRLGVGGGVGDQTLELGGEVGEGGGQPLTFDNQMLAQVSSTTVYGVASAI